MTAVRRMPRSPDIGCFAIRISLGIWVLGYTGYPLYSSDEIAQYAEIEGHGEGGWLRSSSSSSSDSSRRMARITDTIHAKQVLSKRHSIRRVLLNMLGRTK